MLKHIEVNAPAQNALMASLLHLNLIIKKILISKEKEQFSCTCSIWHSNKAYSPPKTANPFAVPTILLKSCLNNPLKNQKSSFFFIL